MAKQQSTIQTLRDRGLTCGKLKSRITDSLKDSSEYRKLGLSRPANAEENVARYLRQIKNKVCLLK